MVLVMSKKALYDAIIYFLESELSHAGYSEDSNESLNGIISLFILIIYIDIIQSYYWLIVNYQNLQCS